LVYADIKTQKKKEKETTRKTQTYVGDNIKMDLKEDWVVWAGIMSLRIVICGGLF
jgi:hypothetical protein